MLSKTKLQLITGLGKKKFRNKHKLFVAEGEKLIQELLNDFSCRYIFQTSNVQLVLSETVECFDIEVSEMQRISNLHTPSTCLAVFELPEPQSIEHLSETGLILVLDGIQDPGNLGTIFRLANWFSISAIVCSNDCVDAFNSKVVQSTMGALGRVLYFETDLKPFLEKTALPIYGTFMDGSNIYQQNLPKHAIVVIGNEGSGISAGVERCVTERITIPSFTERPVESLNAAMATSIVCNEFMRSTQL